MSSYKNAEGENNLFEMAQKAGNVIRMAQENCRSNPPTTII